MEEIWKDISLSNHGISSPPLSLRHRTAAAFENFLSVAFKDSHPPPSSDPLPSPTLSHRSGHHSLPFLPCKRSTTDHPPSPTVSNGDEERRWKKMIKNRESAARSRARKQAYTTELEKEVDLLVQENAALKREQEALKTAIGAQATRKVKLQRASSLPF